MIDIYEYLKALKNAVNSLFYIVNDLIELMPNDNPRKGGIRREYKHAHEKFYEHRCARFDKEIADAEAVLNKAAGIGDYGACWGDDPFIKREYIQELIDEKMKERGQKKTEVTIPMPDGLKPPGIKKIKPEK